MDSFSTIFFSKPEEIVAETPINEESGGGSGGGYCVVSRTEAETPVNEESGGGSGGGYCIIA